MLRLCRGGCFPGLGTGTDVDSGPLDVLSGHEHRLKREAWLEAEIERLLARREQLEKTHSALTSDIEERQLAAERARIQEEEKEELGRDMAESSGQERGHRPSFSIKDVDGPLPTEDMVRQHSMNSITNSISIFAAGVGQAFGVPHLNSSVLKGSARRFRPAARAAVYLVAFGGVLFVLLAASLKIGNTHQDEHPLSQGIDHGSDSHAGHDGHRRLFHEVPALLKNIAYTLTGVGLMTLIVNAVKQPLILGYILGGVLVGPQALKIVEDHREIAEFSNLGLLFLLFMIGMELDMKELLKMGKVVLLTGFLQFPVCAGCMYFVFMGLTAAGLSFGEGPYPALYCGGVCGISSTMIVAKLLGEKGEVSSQTGRLTIGILIFQDIWAIVVLAIQPNLADPQILGILGTFGMIAVLIVVALIYAKLVLPALLYYASTSVQLMLVLSLAWCFFICIIAILPFIGLSMELASLIAGAALATFPYSAEFNGKITFIRDFFITLFFADLGMQIPIPTVLHISQAMLIALVVLAFRWVGIFGVVKAVGGDTRLAAISTINLSEVSEFALVITSLGMGFGHVDIHTMTIIIWTFVLLAISASYLIVYNEAVFKLLKKCVAKITCTPLQEQGDENEVDGHEHEERDIVLLGFHRVADMFMSEMQAKSPALIKRLHVIDINQSIMGQLRGLGCKCSYGDFSVPSVLEHAHHGQARLVICTIPDSQLHGTSNSKILKTVKSVWKDASIIVTADNPYQASELYRQGADYVLRLAKLCAERLREMLSDQLTRATDDYELTQIFKEYRARDTDYKYAGRLSEHSKMH